MKPKRPVGPTAFPAGAPPGAGHGSAMELLAPGGTMETFAAAVAAGADAVYIGAPGANARALARDFTPPELAAMINHAHQRGVRVYAAMNSLIKQDELPAAAATVELLAGLGIDALIIQDLGLYRLCRRFFPDLRLHASTLLGAHNSLTVRQFAAMGFARVVLARELTLTEIAAIQQESPVELEVFVHGAMCFSYSGLCLFSSYFGGKSGLRGRCVQPCRRAYRWAGKPGRAGSPEPSYLFSMNDLEALELLPELQRIGVGSVKIEGRMKSARYVDRVVRAYRLVLDAMAASGSRQQKPAVSGPDLAPTLAAGRELLAEAMGRRTGAGFFQLPFKDLVSPAHSGNIGLFLGKISAAHGDWATLTLRHALRKGDRVRWHREPGGDRQAFTVREIKPATPAELAVGTQISLLLPAAARPGDSLYKVDLADRRHGEARAKLLVSQEDRRRAARLSGLPLPPKLREFVGSAKVAGRRGAKISADFRSAPSKPGPKLAPKLAPNLAPNLPLMAGSGRPGRSSGRGGRELGRQRRPEAAALPLWLRCDDPRLLQWRLPPEVKQLVVPLHPAGWPRFAAAEKAWRKLAGRLIWSLPPVILNEDLPFYREKIAWLLEMGCKYWQLGHPGQSGFFRSAGPVVLHGDYTLNILNAPAAEYCRESGLATVQAAIETDRQNLAGLLGAGIPVGLTIYGRPALFTSRLDSVHFRHGVPLYSPRDEGFVLVRDFGQTLALAEQPFSLLPYAGELAAAGLAYGVIDLRWQQFDREGLARLLRQAGHLPRRRPAASDFNFRLGLA